MSAVKRRPRRIAADEAHSWCRNLRLKNLEAKAVLSSLTLYVNSEGFCFVSIPTLAFDCELSAPTIRRRLAWLENVGAISRSPQWLDQNGSRSSTGRGKRTTDTIRLLLDADEHDIEARAAGEYVAEVPTNADDNYISSDDESATKSSPTHQVGLNSNASETSTAPAVSQPYHSGEGSDSSNPEPEPESPLTPPGTRAKMVSGEEPEHFEPAWLGWPGRLVGRRDLGLAAFCELTTEQQLHCRAAVPLFAQEFVKSGRKFPMGFHLWIRARGFDEFPGAKLASSPAVSTGGLVEVASTAGDALVALYAVAKALRPFQSQGKFVYRGEITPRVLAFAGVVGDRESWPWIEDKAQIAAWSSFIAEHVKAARSTMVVTRGSGADARTGIYAPWPWPPRKDGTLSPETPSSDNSGTVS